MKFYNREGKEVEAIGAHIGEIVSFSTEDMLVDLSQVRIDLVTDVENPLCGPAGATFVLQVRKVLPLLNLN